MHRPTIEKRKGQIFFLTSVSRQVKEMGSYITTTTIVIIAEWDQLSQKKAGLR